MLDFQPREVRCPVTGFRWMARTKAEARLRWLWPTIMLVNMLTAFAAGVLIERFL